MNPNRKLQIVLVIAIVILSAVLLLLIKAPGGQDSTQAMAVPDETGAAATEGSREAAPDFHVYTKDGTAVKLSDFRGQAVVVNFWASWCGPCLRELPDFESKYLEHGEAVQFLMVNMTDGRSETVEVASRCMEDQGFTFPVYYDSDASAATAYQVQAIPATYFIDADGNIAASAAGAIDSHAIQAGIDRILDK